MAHRVARRIATLIEERQAVDQQAVLDLPTGSTPIGVYQELVRMHQEDGLDLSNVVTFNPLSKADLDRKVEAIFKHESQKDRAMFPGTYDDREFWERARDRNRDTADALNGLWLPESYAAEAFVTTYDIP